MTDRSTVRSLEDLGACVLADPTARAAYDAQRLLDESQWLSPLDLETYQLERLKDLVSFAAREVPYWKERIAPDHIAAASCLNEALALLPTLSRDRVHDDVKSLTADTLPGGHKPGGVQSSSGSTGLVVRVASTDLFQRWQKILSLRCYLWAGFDFTRRIAVIRRQPPGVAAYPDGKSEERWDRPSGVPFPTGPSFQLNTEASLEQQWDWLVRVRPDYLYAMPSLLRGFARLVGEHGDPRVQLRSILTTGEVVDSELRALVRRNLKTAIHDRYSSQEAGCIAIQCPGADCYHVASETTIVEILDADGKPCRPGEIGRVVVTPLYNYATPLIRYELGDYAQLGGQCCCGRGLPTLSRIMGRRRNILITADGRHYWPTLHNFDFFNVAQSREHQFRQIAPNVLEVWLVVESPRTAAQEDEMRKILRASLPAPFEIRFRYVDEFPRRGGSKHDEFVSFVAEPPRQGVVMPARPGASA